MLSLAATAAVIALAGSPAGELAAATANGDLLVRQPDDDWLRVATCAAAPALAWRDETLFWACPGEPLQRWRRDRPGPEAGARSAAVSRAGSHAGSAAGSHAGSSAADSGLPCPVQLAGGDALLAVDAEGGIWRLADGPAERVGDPPEPVEALAVIGGALLAAGTSAIWRRDGSAWRPIAALAARSLAADGSVVYAVDEHGLWRLDGSALRLLDPEPALAVAIAGGRLWVSTPSGIAPHDTAPGPWDLAARAGAVGLSALPAGPGETATDTAARARRARWLPDLVAGVSRRDRLDGGGGVELWLLLRWALDDLTAVPPLPRRTR